MENVFKALQRQGAENGVLNIQRCYNTAATACEAAFPGVAQQEVAAEDVNDCWGWGNWEDTREQVFTLGRDKRSLSLGAFRVPETSWIPRPSTEDATMGAASHSSQVAFEECLLACDVQDGRFVRLEPLTRSWTCSLVHTVGSTAKDMYEPSILHHVCSGRIYLIYLNSGRCLWGWPLVVLSSERCVLGLLPMAKATSIIITNACLWKCSSSLDIRAPAAPAAPVDLAKLGRVDAHV